MSKRVFIVCTFWECFKQNTPNISGLFTLPIDHKTYEIRKEQLRVLQFLMCRLQYRIYVSHNTNLDFAKNIYSIIKLFIYANTSFIYQHCCVVFINSCKWRDYIWKITYNIRKLLFSLSSVRVSYNHAYFVLFGRRRRSCDAYDPTGRGDNFG